MNTKRTAAIGIDLGGTHLVLLSQLEATGEIYSESLPTGKFFTPKQLPEQLTAFIHHQNLAISHLGLAVPGLVNTSGAVEQCDVLPEFKGWKAAKALQGLAKQVAVLNDVQAALLEETHDLSAQATAGVIMVGTAIGAAFITNGAPLLGAKGWAGELGYLPLSCNQQVKRLDELAGGAALAKALKMSPAQLVAKAQAGDLASLQAIQQAGKYFGLGLAAVINLLNPSHLFIGGGTSHLPSYWSAAMSSAKAHVLPELWQHLSVNQIAANKPTVALGAIRAARKKY